MRTRSLKKRSRGSWLLAALAGLLMLVLAPACGEDPVVGLLLAITSDVDIQYSVDAVGLSIENQGNVVVSTVNPIKDGTKFVVFFPATLLVFPPKDGEATVRVRAVAYYQNNARIIRQAIVTVPRDHLRLLRMPLFWGNQIPANTTQPAESYLLPQQLVDGCPEDQTRINGVCAPSKVDSTKLPICSDAYCTEVLRARKNSLDDVTCFNAGVCFPAACSTNVAPLFEREGDSCRFRYRGPAGADVKRLNFALTLPDANPAVTTVSAATYGQCTDRIAHKGCFATVARNAAALDPLDVEGWTIDGDLATGTITLPPWVCARATDPGTSLIASFGCDAIYTDMLPCGENQSFTDPITFSPACTATDAGVDASSTVDASDAATNADTSTDASNEGG